MARSTAVGNETALVIERAALDAFYEKGYHGATIREIAGRAGIGVSTLFHHYPSKAAMLERLLSRAVVETRMDLEVAIEGLEDPCDRLAAGVRAMVISHCERLALSFLAQSEYRRLVEPAREPIRQRRRRLQGVFDEIVEAGIEAGEMHCDNPRVVARAIVSLTTAVAHWFQPGGELGVEDVAQTYVAMALRMVGAAVPAEPR
jgi:AcrR family transcriptional regulator